MTRCMCRTIYVQKGPSKFYIFWTVILTSILNSIFIIDLVSLYETTAICNLGMVNPEEENIIHPKQ